MHWIDTAFDAVLQPLDTTDRYAILAALASHSHLFRFIQSFDCWISVIKMDLCDESHSSPGSASGGSYKLRTQRIQIALEWIINSAYLRTVSPTAPGLIKKPITRRSPDIVFIESGWSPFNCPMHCDLELACGLRVMLLESWTSLDQNVAQVPEASGVSNCPFALSASIHRWSTSASSDGSPKLDGFSSSECQTLLKFGVLLLLTFKRSFSQKTVPGVLVQDWRVDRDYDSGRYRSFYCSNKFFIFSVKGRISFLKFSICPFLWTDLV